MKFYFTFGSGHRCKKHHSLGENYVVIEAPDENQARDLMFEKRRNKWSFVYRSAEEAGVDRWKLKELSLEDVTLGVPQF